MHASYPRYPLRCKINDPADLIFIDTPNDGWSQYHADVVLDAILNNLHFYGEQCTASEPLISVPILMITSRSFLIVGSPPENCMLHLPEVFSWVILYTHIHSRSP